MENSYLSLRPPVELRPNYTNEERVIEKQPHQFHGRKRRKPPILSMIGFPLRRSRERSELFHFGLLSDAPVRIPLFENFASFCPLLLPGDTKIYTTDPPCQMKFLEISGKMGNPQEILRKSSDHLRKSSDHLRPPQTASDRLRPSQTASDHLRPPQTISDHATLI